MPTRQAPPHRTEITPGHPAVAPPSDGREADSWPLPRDAAADPGVPWGRRRAPQVPAGIGRLVAPVRGERLASIDGGTSGWDWRRRWRTSPAPPPRPRPESRRAPARVSAGPLPRVGRVGSADAAARSSRALARLAVRTATRTWWEPAQPEVGHSTVMPRLRRLTRPRYPPRSPGGATRSRSSAPAPARTSVSGCRNRRIPECPASASLAGVARSSASIGGRPSRGCWSAEPTRGRAGQEAARPEIACCFPPPPRVGARSSPRR